MGTPKHAILLPDGRAMIEHVADVLRQVCPRLVVLGPQSPLPDAPAMGDLRPGHGPLAGIETLLASGIDETYLVLPCDMPRLSTEALHALLNVPPAPAAALRFDGEVQCLPLRVSTAAMPVVRAMLDRGERAVHRLIASLPAAIVEAPAAWAERLININTPDELTRMTHEITTAASRSDRTILLATSNPHKLEEVRDMLAPRGFAVIGLNDLGVSIPEPEENGATFEENARIKAIAYARATGRICLADDSGLEVDALHGAPGVHSAYYAGLGDTRTERDRANNDKLLRELARLNLRPEQRTARFVCVMCLAAPDGRLLAETRGTFEGLIAEAPRGTNGFGYDPLLFLPDRGCTSAELSPAEKNARSHRGQAARRMAEALDRLQRSYTPA